MAPQWVKNPLNHKKFVADQLSLRLLVISPSLSVKNRWCVSRRFVFMLPQNPVARPICRHFLESKCTYGDHCRFSHSKGCSAWRDVCCGAWFINTFWKNNWMAIASRLRWNQPGLSLFDALQKSGSRDSSRFMSCSFESQVENLGSRLKTESVYNCVHLKWTWTRLCKMIFSCSSCTWLIPTDSPLTLRQRRAGQVWMTQLRCTA